MYDETKPYIHGSNCHCTQDTPVENKDTREGGEVRNRAARRAEQFGQPQGGEQQAPEHQGPPLIGETQSLFLIQPVEGRVIIQTAAYTPSGLPLLDKTDDIIADPNGTSTIHEITPKQAIKLGESLVHAGKLAKRMASPTAQLLAAFSSVLNRG